MTSRYSDRRHWIKLSASGVDRNALGKWPEMFSKQQNGDDAQHFQDDVFGFVIVRVDIGGQVLS